MFSTAQVEAAITFFEFLGYKCHEMWKNPNECSENILKTFPYLIIHKDTKAIHFNQGEFGRATKFEY